MNISDFYRSKPIDICLAIQGLRNSEVRGTKMEWERVRTMCTWIMQPRLRKTIRPKDLCTFPWEKVENLFELNEANKHIFDKLTMDGEWKPVKEYKN